MDQSIIILGAPCVGKTWVLNKIFLIGDKETYGIHSSLSYKGKDLNGYRYIPEITGNQLTDGLKLFIKNNKIITGISIAQPFGLYHVKEAKILILDASDDDLFKHINRRGKSKGKKTVIEKLDECKKWRDKLRKDYPNDLFNQIELIEYLKNKGIHNNNQLKLL